MIITDISWADSSQNFWEGCNKVSTECMYCYMMRILDRFGKKYDVVRRVSNSTFIAPLKWKEPKVIFTCSMSDFFHKAADDWRNDAWDVIRATPHHQWLILTKRTNRILKCLPKDWGNGWENVKLGFSAGNQPTLIRRFNDVINIPTKNKFFISAEPLLSRIDLTPVFSFAMPPSNGNPGEVVNLFDWVILGGESGNNIGEWRFRPCDLRWLEFSVLQCREYGVNVLVKQMGTHIAGQLGLKSRDGKDLTEAAIPEILKIEQIPNHLKIKPL